MVVCVELTARSSLQPPQLDSEGGFGGCRDVMPTITRLERQKRHPERVNVYLDGEFAFGLPDIDAARLSKGQTLSEAEIEQLRSQDTLSKAVDQALRLLAMRPRSIQEVRLALGKKHNSFVVEQAIERLVAMGYLDDAAFAAYWVENRMAFKPLSSRALRYELSSKGVPDAIIRDVLSHVVEAEAALLAARSQVRRLEGQTSAAFAEHLMAFLQRRGFSYSTARDAIRTLKAQLDEEHPSFFADA